MAHPNHAMEQPMDRNQRAVEDKQVSNAQVADKANPVNFAMKEPAATGPASATRAFSLHKALDPQMPKHLRELAHHFAALEFALNSCVLYQRIPFFDVLKLAIESSRQSTFTKDHLQMILSVLPNAYSLTEAKQNPKDVSKSLVIRRRKLTTQNIEPDQVENQDPAQETMTTRIETFVAKLNEFVSAQRKDIQQEFPGLSSEELQSALELLELDKKALQIDNLPQEKDTSIARSQLVRKRKASDTGADDTNDSAKQSKVDKPIPKELQSLPKWLIDQVRRREQTLDAITKKKAQSAATHLLQTLPQLCDQLESLALVQRRNTIELQQLKQKLQLTKDRTDQLEEQLHLLESMVPKWLSIACFDGKQFVKLNRQQVKFRQIKSELRQAIAEQLQREQEPAK